jgi:hypothetical protein
MRTTFFNLGLTLIMAIIAIVNAVERCSAKPVNYVKSSSAAADEITSLPDGDDTIDHGTSVI